MSQIISPPDIYFNGINFNSSFYVEDTAGFTESQANALYLRKTITDTATALETFSSGLETTTLKTTGVTNMLNSLLIRDALTGATNTLYYNPNTPNYPFMSLASPFNTLSMYVESGGNTANINCLASKTLNIVGAVNDVTLNVGTGPRTSAVVHHYSDGDNAVAGANVHLNNGSGNLSNTAIHNGINSVGALNLATGSGASTAISIGTNGATATANRIRIGSVTRQTYLDSDILNMGTNGLTGSGAISIATGTNTAGAQVSIGSVSLTALNLKGVQTNVETTTLNLNTTGAGNTLIGTSGGSNSITINRPLTIGYTPPSLTTSTQIGFISTAFAGGGLPLVTVSNYGYFNITTSGLPLGVYHCIVQIVLTPGSGSQKLSLNIGQGVSGLTVTGVNVNTYNASGTTEQWYSTTSLFVKITDATTSYLTTQAYSQTANSTVNSANLYAMRVA